MVWDDKYLVGIEKIDDQHKMLFLITDRLKTAIKNGNGEKEIARTFRDLIDYTKYHFAFEELMMQEVLFSSLPAHRVWHQNLVKSIKDILLRIREGKNYNPIELLRFLNNWLIGHILDKDMVFGEFCKSTVCSVTAHMLPGVSWLKTNLQKNNELLRNKLLEIDGFIAEKKKLFNTLVNSRKTWDENGIREIFDGLELFVKQKLMHENDREDLLNLFFEKVDFEAIIKAVGQPEAESFREYLQKHSLTKKD